MDYEPAPPETEAKPVAVSFAAAIVVAAIGSLAFVLAVTDALQNRSTGGQTSVAAPVEASAAQQESEAPPSSITEPEAPPAVDPSAEQIASESVEPEPAEPEPSQVAAAPAPVQAVIEAPEEEAPAATAAGAQPTGEKPAPPRDPSFPLRKPG